MSEIRHLAGEDLPQVADLFQRVLLKRSVTARDSLITYLKELFVDPVEARSGFCSHVYVKPDGEIAGFIGVLALPMRLHGAPVMAAVASCLMVDNHAENPLVGARLLRTFLAGPQDISLSETASDTAVAMWRALRGITVPSYSLDWVRVINPAGFLVELFAGRLRFARSLMPLSRCIDAWARHRANGAALRWSSVAAGSHTPGSGNYSDIPVDAEKMAELVAQFASRFSLHPNWPSSDLSRVLIDSERKDLYGKAQYRMVISHDETPVGAFIYYGRERRIGHVLQVLSAPGRSGVVIDRLIDHAARSGVVALQGRTQPELLDAMLTRRCAFAHRSATVVHARNPIFLKPFLSGEAFFNGLAGETWTRLIGNSWSAEQ
ncbi:hypothetical protein [Microvirga mediterraneensis]|uniref:Uncharacterized protein n=1 Tax=Microvirga mediterraneensis TaxID=2754695 RepID=A0A838BNJ4_9HYPH|nr:hypothetical protein [Microvirga mediterraneensis]MBA1157018.1 hypothetical protein [Microvirga mediterraneensis]